ncbi:MAG: DMT family transporter [Pseudomonadota bacterium]|nr:DMT family transporter [Pseudomonadota bacterium]
MNEEKNISRDLVKGIFLLLIGASMLGGSGIFVKLSDSSPSLIAFYRSLFALPFLYAWMKFEERNDSAKIIWDKKTFFFLVLGGLCFALDMSIWNWSLTFTSVANATLMANIAPVFVVIFGVLFLGYKIEIFFIVTLLLALMGVFLVILPGEQIMVFGDSLGILAAVFYAGYILSIKDLTNILKPARTLFLVTIITTLCLLPISLIEADSLILSKSEFFILISYAIFSQTLAQGLITSGISKVSAHLSSLVLLMQPVAAAFYGWFFLQELLSPLQMAGGLIVLAAIYLASRE